MLIVGCLSLSCSHIDDINDIDAFCLRRIESLNTGCFSPRSQINIIKRSYANLKMIQDALMVKNREFLTRRVMALELQALHSLGTAREREKKDTGQNPSPETNLYTHDTT